LSKLKDQNATVQQDIMTAQNSFNQDYSLDHYIMPKPILDKGKAPDVGDAAAPPRPEHVVDRGKETTDKGKGPAKYVLSPVERKLLNKINDLFDLFDLLDDNNIKDLHRFEYELTSMFQSYIQSDRDDLMVQMNNAVDKIIADVLRKNREWNPVPAAPAPASPPHKQPPQHRPPPTYRPMQYDDKLTSQQYYDSLIVQGFNDDEATSMMIERERSKDDPNRKQSDADAIVAKSLAEREGTSGVGSTMFNAAAPRPVIQKKKS